MNSESAIKKIWRIFYPVLIHLGITLAVSFLGTFILVIKYHTLSTDRLLEESARCTVLFLGIATVFMLPLFIFFMKRDIKRGNTGYIDKNIHNTAVDWLLAVILSISTAIWIENMIVITGLSKLFTGYEEVSEALFASGIWLQIAVLGIFVPIVEELMFRGLIYRRLKLYMGWRHAVLLTALGFGIYHGNAVQGIYAFCLSLILILLYERMGTIAAPIAGHMAVNLTSVFQGALSSDGEVYQSVSFFLIVTAAAFVISIFTFCLFYKKNQTGDRN